MCNFDMGIPSARVQNGKKREASQKRKRSDRKGCVVHSGPTARVVMGRFVTRDLKANAEHTTRVGSARESLVMRSLEKEIHATTENIDSQLLLES